MTRTDDNSMAEGQHLTGESGSSYLVVSPMTRAQPGAPTPNVWSAVDSSTHSDVFILKQPAGDETASSASGAPSGYPAARPAWPRFQSEMVMHELFKDNPFIRQQVDRIPPQGGSDQPPRIVLEPTETTLWGARTSRPLTDGEIGVVMGGALEGLKAIHKEGLVYADLKPDNIFVNGFRETADETSAENSLHAVIGDLGLVMAPTVGKVQPLVYRAPEVHFKSSITPAADIWSWGMIYTHLLQAQRAPAAPGLYDSTLAAGASALEIEQAIRRALNDDFDLANNPYYDDCVLPSGHSRAESEVWSQRLRNAGVPSDAVEFLAWVLDPDPRRRPGADEILGSAWLRERMNAKGNRNSGIFLPPPDIRMTEPEGEGEGEARTQAQARAQAQTTNDQWAAAPNVGDVYVSPLSFHNSATSLLAGSGNGTATPRPEPSTPIPIPSSRLGPRPEPSTPGRAPAVQAPGSASAHTPGAGFGAPASPMHVSTPSFCTPAARAPSPGAALNSHPPGPGAFEPVRIERFVGGGGGGGGAGLKQPQPPIKRAHESYGDESRRREGKKVHGGDGGEGVDVGGEAGLGANVVEGEGEGGADGLGHGERKGGLLNGGLMGLLKGE